MDELILKEKETKENLVKIINESGLPAMILKPMLKEFLEQLNIVEQQQYAIAFENKQKEEQVVY